MGYSGKHDKKSIPITNNVSTTGGASGFSGINIKTGKMIAINTYINVGDTSCNFFILYKRSDK